MFRSLLSFGHLIDFFHTAAVYILYFNRTIPSFHPLLSSHLNTP